MKFAINTLTPQEQEYPQLLREIVSSPAPLYYKGELPLINDRMIAIIGTRKATKQGKVLAKRFAQELAEHGVVVVSGLALGIDGAAHQGALLGGGRTIAVLANGLDSIYPREHLSLAETLLRNNGCIFSEYESGTPAYPTHFLERNRIISGLSLGVVVIEAPNRSGALSTACHALEQGREVFVVPGSPESENYKGSHRLLREGARLVTTAKEILDDLSPLDKLFDTQSDSAVRHSERVTDDKERSIIKALRHSEALSASEIIQTTGVESAIVNQKLGILTLKGIINEVNGKYEINYC